MSVVDIAQPRKRSSWLLISQLHLLMGIDGIAYSLLRVLVLFVDTIIGKCPILIEKGAAVLLCSGRINLSEKQGSDGWRTTLDEAGYFYAYFEDWRRIPNGMDCR